MKFYEEKKKFVSINFMLKEFKIIIKELTDFSCPFSEDVFDLTTEKVYDTDYAITTTSYDELLERLSAIDIDSLKISYKNIVYEKFEAYRSIKKIVICRYFKNNISLSYEQMLFHIFNAIRCDFRFAKFDFIKRITKEKIDLKVIALLKNDKINFDIDKLLNYDEEELKKVDYYLYKKNKTNKKVHESITMCNLIFVSRSNNERKIYEREIDLLSVRDYVEKLASEGIMNRSTVKILVKDKINNTYQTIKNINFVIVTD